MLCSIDNCHKKVSVKEYHMTILQLKLTANQALFFDWITGSGYHRQVVQKTVNANPGLKVCVV